MNIEDESRQTELLKFAVEGDKQAFGLLYEKYLDEIYRFAYYKVGDSMLAEDITEETFLKTWESLPKLYAKGQKMGNFRAWLYRIAHNLVIDYYRKKKPEQLGENQYQSKALSPEEISERHALTQRIIAALKKLEPKLQQIIILRFINQLSHQETASIMNISNTYSRVLQYRAIKALKVILLKKETHHV